MNERNYGNITTQQPTYRYFERPLAAKEGEKMKQDRSDA